MSSNTPDAFKCKLLEGLLKDAQKGRGTDLEVLIPSKSDSCSNNNHDDRMHDDDDDDDDDEGCNARVSKESKHAATKIQRSNTASYHLHSTIAAASSKYFATFPTPKTGRIIDDIDSESFSICVQFMYTGEYQKGLSHENVSSVLYAAELLQMDELKVRCLDYLEQNLDHSNYEIVTDLADRYNCAKLKKEALRFQSENSSRDTLLAKRESLVKKIGIASYEVTQLLEREKVWQKHLEQTELQLKHIFQTQQYQILSNAWEEERKKKKDSITIPFESDTFRKPDTVGHFVYNDPNAYYDGSSTYDAEEEGSYYEGEGRPPPPPPTREQYEQHGIVHAHDLLETAVKKAKEGDRIYLPPGHHVFPREYDDSSDLFCIDHDLYFIGLGANDETDEHVQRTRIVTGYGDYDTHRFRAHRGMLGFYNIAFRSLKGSRSCDAPNYAQGSGGDAVIIVQGDTAEVIVKDCTFELGADSESSHPTRVSGIFFQGGKSAIVEGCKFLGGAGSAIVLANVNNVNNPKIQIINNFFAGNGQPTFSEKSATEAFDAKSKRLIFKSIPSNEVTPGPSSLEFWRCAWSKTSRTTTVKLEGNNFESNLRAPLAYRVVHMLDHKNDWHLLERPPSGDEIKGFDLVAMGNAMRNNGLQFDDNSIRRMRCKMEQKAKKMRTEDDENSNMKFPDGDSLLIIQHFMSQYDENSFPWECSDCEFNEDESGGYESDEYFDEHAEI